MSAAAQKFLFDLCFDDPPSAERSPELPEVVVEPPPPSFTTADLEAARAAGIAEGRARALEEAEKSHSARLSRTLDEVASGLAELLAQREEIARKNEADSIELMLGLARKILPELARRCAFDELVGLVRACIEEAIDEPRIVVRVPDTLFDDARERITQVAAAAGYAGKVVILADAQLGPEDARVEWADGGAERDLGRLWAEIDLAARRAVETLTQFRGE